MANFFADLFTGGAASRNEAARAANENTKKNIERQYSWQYGDPNSGELGGEAGRQYEHAVKGLEITKKNVNDQIDFQEAERNQAWGFGMGIREYEHTQNMRVYDQSVSRAVQQQSFNELARGAALVDQDRLIHEQLLSISFDETESLLNYGAAAAGLGLQKRKARAAAVTQAQTERISALKARGASVARGVSGRTAGKDIQGLMAESGARQAAIIDELMYNTEGIDLDFMRLNKQYAIDQVAFQASRDSATMSDAAARAKIAQQALQAAINAEASIMLKPEIAPPLPKPIALPRPEFQDIFKPSKPPMTSVGAAPQENLFTAGLGTAIGVGSFVASGLSGQGGIFGGNAGTDGKFRGFNWGKAFGFG